MLSAAHKTLLHDIARDSIGHGLQKGEPLLPASENYASVLTENRATFVTLNKQGQLRGCIGSLQARRPLIEDVAHNAFAAAFHDTRFSPLQADELPAVDIHIALLGTAETIQADSEQALLRQLRPGIDGLILEEQGRRATFLPAVWESLQDKQTFVQQLKMKAGLPADYWSDSIRFQRYQTESW